MASGCCFISLSVRAFSTRLLNFILDEIGNRSFACWFYLDFSFKSPYTPTDQRVCTRVTVGKRFAVCSGAKNICISLARRRNDRHVLNLRSRYRRETKYRLPPKNYRSIAKPPNKYRHILVLPLPPKSLPPTKKKAPTSKNLPPYFGFNASAKVVTDINEKTANRLKITTVWQYRPACIRLKNRYRRPP